MPGFLRALLLFPLFLAIGLVLDGVVASFAEVLGSGARMEQLAALLTFVPLALGAFHRGAGHPPLRARFLLLGFVAALPLAAGFAPLGALLILFFILPLRALGAQLHAAVASHPFGLALLLCGVLAAKALVLATGIGLPLFLVAWALAALLQRYLVAPEQPASPPMEPAARVQAFLLGLGLTSLFFFMRPYLGLADSGALGHDLGRLLGLAGVALFFWATFGLGFAESKLRLNALALAALGLALTLPAWTDYLAWFSSPEGYARFFGDERLRGWPVNSPDPILAEDHRFYGALGAIFLYAWPLGLAVIAVRCLDWPRALGPFLLGIAFGFLGALLSGAAMVAILGTIAAGILFATALVGAGLGHPQPVRASVQVAGVLILGGLFLRQVPRPELAFPLQTNFTWEVAELDPSEAAEGERRLQETTLGALPQWIERGAGVSLGRLFLADGRNLLQPGRARQEAQLRSMLFAASLLPRLPERVAVVGSPDPAASQLLARSTGAALSIITDPPALGRMAFRLSQVSDAEDALPEHDFHGSLVRAEGPFDLIVLQGRGWWEGRHSVLRASKLRQAKLRLGDGGLCVFTCAPDQLEPGVLPAWLASFAAVFPDMRMWIVPDDIAHLRLVVAGSNGNGEAPWPPQGPADPGLDRALAQVGFPLAMPADRDALEVQLSADALPWGPHFLFRAPWHPVDRRLATTAPRPEREFLRIERAAAVLAELDALRPEPGVPDVLSFYRAEIGAQEYSVHDTYLDDNPYAIEVGKEALEALYRLAQEHPHAASTEQLWRWAIVSLVEQREIGWLDDYLHRLQDELGWQQPFLRLGLAHAAMEMLDFETALGLLQAILAEDPDNPAAQEMIPYAEAGEQLPRDEHAGHDHD